ncbi:MAG: hypothetical protein ACLPM8_04555 [Myxococcaceae bacterium]
MRWLALAVFTLGLLCCGPQQIQGSLSSLLNLQYNTVRLGYTGGSVDGGVMTNGEVSVAFLEVSGKTESAVLVVTEDLTDLQVEPGGMVNLTQVPPSGVGQRGVVTRAVANDPVTTFPALQRGSMTLGGTPIPGSGQSMGGAFNVTFEDCPEFACGFTAFASFTAQVQ